MNWETEPGGTRQLNPSARSTSGKTEREGGRTASRRGLLYLGEFGHNLRRDLKWSLLGGPRDLIITGDTRTTKVLKGRGTFG